MKMTETVEEAGILQKIQDTYVPFLKKIIVFLEKNKKATPENISKLRAIYTIFTTASSQEQIETFHVNQKKLEHWYNKFRKEKRKEDGGSHKTKKQFSQSSDTESSQGTSDIAQPPAKKKCTVINSLNDESSQSANQHSISSDKSTSVIPNHSQYSSQIKKEDVSSQLLKADVIHFPPATVHPKPPVSDSNPSNDEPITFTCASCQFQTHNEAEFMKHARANHKTDLSMWCKECGKCFSNAGILISHIKRRGCIKEEMIYKCGAKECTFETSVGQTFIHHLRHCHKGSPFIFCVHCQKIFTLPHCLVLHMQDDCPHKDKNRRNPGAGGSTNVQPETHPKSSPMNTITEPKPAFALQTKTAAETCSASMPVVQSPVVRAAMSLATTSRGRRRSVRGRGRGRGRSRISDSSDSDDPDDPSWLLEDPVSATGLRRSARWAKKMNDVMNPEPSASGVSSAKKSFTSDELNSKMINCPCCDFMAAFQSVLEDHYIANHKVPNKNACLVCHLKFEDTRSFFDHFEDHKTGLLPSKPPPEVISEIVQQQIPKLMHIPEITSTAFAPDSTIVLSNIESVNTNTVPEEKEPFEGVLISICNADLANSVAQDKVLNVPYQAAIHDKNLNDPKLKKFEALKSPNDLILMKNIQKLKDFFKCGLYNCSFTTDLIEEFATHLKEQHDNKLYQCCYCLKEESDYGTMVNHIVSKHNKRTYQCSKCFYRGYSATHVQIHIKNYHVLDSYTDILICNRIKLPDNVTEEEESFETLNTTWPYICAIGNCDFSTYDPKEFKKHNETIHITATVFYCRYCKVDFLLFKRLMNHYRLHGLNLFQCDYCIHGAETKEEILIHLCNVHADQPLKAYMRGSEDEVSSEIKELQSVMNEESIGLSLEDISSARKDILVENPSKNARKDISYTGCENELYHVIDNKCYPKHLQSMCFPRYLKNLLSNVICGIPFCNEKFQTIHLYINHLRSAHDALNFPCPHCPEMSNSWEDFKNHLLCHRSKLYACGSKECEFYDWNKEKVKEHKKAHQDSDYSVFSVRDFSPENEDNLHSLCLNTEFPDIKDIFICLFCKYKSSDKNIMKNHMYREMAYERFDCSLCEKKCVSRKEIKDHFITFHPELDILCSVDCNSEVETAVKAILIQQQKFQDVKLAESCDMCCRKFKNFLQLQCHLYICLQKKYRPYECHHCKKCFVNLLALKYHTDKEHHPKAVEYAFIPNYAIEEDIEKNLLKVRLKQLKDVFEDKKLEINIDEKSYNIKFYACSHCAFEADHKFNVQRHSKTKHEGMASVTKTHESSSCSSLKSQSDENSNDDTSHKNFVKRYCCGYCIKKMLTIQEVEKHMRRIHTVKNIEYFYYYIPDINVQFSSSDKVIYECAYCKASKDNLFSLKNHADLMHSEMEFKVKGFVSGTESEHNYLACGYCYLRLDSHSELHEHSISSHPSLTLKSIGDCQINKKRTQESLNEFPNKRIKFDSDILICSHCGGAFATVEQITLHSKKSHSRLKLEFSKMDQSLKSTETADVQFYKCEFCKFTAERQFLDKHIASKHKMRVTCSYCSKRFEFASKLKEHHEIHHKNLPIKYSQETVNGNNTSSCDSNRTNSDKNKKTESAIVIPKSISHYGRKSKSVELNSLTVHMETKEGHTAGVPLSYVTEHFNILPKVVLEDVMKKKHDTVYD